MDASTESPPNFRDAAEITYADLQALDSSRTVCVCAVSALEVHGPHLPLGADFHQAAWMADETGRRFARNHSDWTVLRYPPLNLGTDELALPGSLNSPPRVVYQAVRAFGNALAGAGLRYIMITNAHGGPRHAAALEAASRAVSKRHRIAMFSPSIKALHRMVSGNAFDDVEALIGRKLGDDERHGLSVGEHAGTWETSWYLAMHPEWVAPEWKHLEEDHPPPFAPAVRLAGWLRRGRPAEDGEPLGFAGALEHLAGGIGWILNSWRGYGRAPGAAPVTYSGWPAVASPEVGRAYAELPVRYCLDDLEAVTSGRVHADDIKSIASESALIHPSFFRWLALAAGFVLLALVALGAS
jgi:creatinine amidohydrolase